MFLESIRSAQQSDVAGIGNRIPELFNRDSSSWRILMWLLANEGLSSFWKVAAVITVLVSSTRITGSNTATIKLVSPIVVSWLAIIAVIFLTYALSQTS